MKMPFLLIGIFATPRKNSIVYIGYYMEAYMKRIICVLGSFLLLLSIAACGKNNAEGNLTLIKHYGQEKVDEMEIQCTDEAQLKIANSLVGKAREILSYCGTDDNVDTVDCDALKKYYFFSKDANKSDVSIELITTSQSGDSGYIWVKYSAEYYDEAGNLLMGMAETYSRWDIEKVDDVWKVVNIDEIN